MQITRSATEAARFWGRQLPDTSQKSSRTEKNSSRHIWIQVYILGLSVFPFL